MANTYTLISSVAVGAGGTANITFSSIPATYTDLCVLVSARSAYTTTAYDHIKIEFNGSGGTAYSTKMVYGTGSSALSANTSGDPTISWSYISNDSATTSTFGNVQIYIPNYAGSNNKSISSDSVSENNATSAIAALTAGLWANTAAITSIKLTTASASNFMQYSNAYLYGIKNSQEIKWWIQKSQ